MFAKSHHHANPDEVFREQLVKEMAKHDNCTPYGCCGRPSIGGIDRSFAVGGARISVNVNAYGPMKFCHSNRLTRLLAGGTFVMAKWFPDANLLYEDGVHVKCFNELDECFELAGWYLEHEAETKRIADSGMERIHQEFNCRKIAQDYLDLVETGTYNAPWT